MKTVKRITNIIILILAGAVVLNYGVYLAHLIAFPEQPLAFIITFIVLGATILPIFFRKPLKRLLKKAYPVLKGIYAACLAFYVVTFIGMTVMIFRGAGAETPPEELPSDMVLVVYGAKVGGTKESPTPGQFLRFRLDKAVKVLSADSGAVCIVCGGKGSNEPVAEAIVMRDYLVAKGIDANRIYVDAESENTIENIDNAMKIIEENGLENCKVACLSTEYHVPRIKFLCEKAGLGAQYYYYADSPNFFGLWSGLVREYMSYGKLLLTGHL